MPQNFLHRFEFAFIRGRHHEKPIVVHARDKSEAVEIASESIASKYSITTKEAKDGLYSKGTYA